MKFNLICLDTQNRETLSDGVQVLPRLQSSGWIFRMSERFGGEGWARGALPRTIKAVYNSLSPNSDLSQTSHCSIKGLSVREVMRIE